jgi:hypothetical protein
MSSVQSPIPSLQNSANTAIPLYIRFLREKKKEEMRRLDQAA